jgi:hypothetical protein
MVTEFSLPPETFEEPSDSPFRGSADELAVQDPREKPAVDAGPSRELVLGPPHGVTRGMDLGLERLDGCGPRLRIRERLGDELRHFALDVGLNGLLALPRCWVG